MMPSIPEAVRTFAEEPEASISEPVPPEARISTASFSLFLSGSDSQSSVTRVRTTERELDQIIGEIRKTLQQRRYKRVIWHIGPSCRPEGLASLLVERGFVRATEPPFEPEALAMALVTPPPEPPPGATANLARSYEEYLTGLRIAIEAHEMPEDVAQGWLNAAPELWKQQDGVNRMMLVAYVDGRPAGFAFAAGAPAGLMLAGSAVLPAARRRGAYRALVAARWKIAEQLGTPALIIHAGAMSRPILERCGFETVCRIESFEDPTVASQRPG